MKKIAIVLIVMIGCYSFVTMKKMVFTQSDIIGIWRGSEKLGCSTYTFRKDSTFVLEMVLYPYENSPNSDTTVVEGTYRIEGNCIKTRWGKAKYQNETFLIKSKKKDDLFLFSKENKYKLLMIK